MRIFNILFAQRKACIRIRLILRCKKTNKHVFLSLDFWFYTKLDSCLQENNIHSFIDQSINQSADKKVEFIFIQSQRVKSESGDSLPLLGLPGGGIQHPDDTLILLLSLLRLQPLLRLLLR